MKRQTLWCAVILMTMISGGCGGGGTGVTDPSFSTNETGTTSSRSTIDTSNGTVTIPEGTSLTDGTGAPVVGKIMATVSLAGSGFMVPKPETLPTDRELLAYLTITLTGSDGKTVDRLDRDMLVKVSVAGAVSGESLVHYRFNGDSWIAEETVTVAQDNSVELNVSRTTSHALFRVRAKDTTAPSVVLVSPSEGEADVAGNTEIIAVFSEAMDASTITTSTFTVGTFASSVDFGTIASKPIALVDIPGVVRYDHDSKCAVFKPNGLLPRDTVFVATITSGVKDASGNTMVADKSWTFTKETRLDQTRPWVVGSSSTDNGATFLVKFSELMDPFSVNDYLVATEPAVQIKVIYDPVQNKAVVKPTSTLTPGTIYRFTLREKAVDLAGNTLESMTWTFTPAPPTGSAGNSGSGS